MFVSFSLGTCLSNTQADASNRMLKKSANGVLASLRSSTGTRPPHHSAARTDLVLLFVAPCAPEGTPADLRSLRPCWTAFLSILWGGVLLDSQM